MMDLFQKSIEYMKYYEKVTASNIILIHKTRLNRIVSKIKKLKRKSSLLKVLAPKLVTTLSMNTEIAINSIAYYADISNLSNKQRYRLFSIALKSRVSVIILNKAETQKLAALFNANKVTYFSNYNSEINQNIFVTIVGRDSNYQINFPIKKILGIINCYNECDVILDAIYHLIKQGLDVMVIDNFSDDGTYELLMTEFELDKRVFIRRSDFCSDSYEWKRLLKGTEQVSHEFKQQYDWFMHCDADEFRYSPDKRITMQEYISFVDFLGYNAIDLTVLDFRYLDDNTSISQEYEKNLNYFEFGRRPGHFAQVKCWKYAMDISLADSGGHNAIFADRKVYPIKFLLKHYPLRNQTQSEKKIFKDRASRILKEKRESGWHTHYDAFINQSKVPSFEKEKLINWREIDFDTDFLFERISGVGIERE